MKSFLVLSLIWVASILSGCSSSWSVPSTFEAPNYNKQITAEPASPGELPPPITQHVTPSND